jgi:hypothetical protein
MHEPEHERHDPFGEASLLSDLGQFRPRGEGEARLRADIDAVEALAAASGFGDRGPGRGQRVKEPTKTLQFRLPESLVDAFHEAAYGEFGPKHGAKTALFLKLWETYRASNRQEG